MGDNLDNLMLELESVQAVKFGEFKLKSGILSPFYFDLRVIVSYPKLMSDISKLMMAVLSPESLKSTDCVCGVPYTALPLATLIGVQNELPMIIRRKEAKDYGTKKMLEGHFKPGQNCLIIEDVVTSGTSVLETAKILREHGLVVTDAIVLLNREQGGSAALSDQGIKLHSLYSVTRLAELLERHSRISQSMKKSCLEFVKLNQVYPQAIKRELSFHERSKLSRDYPLAEKLFAIMTEKRSNLCVAADVMTMEQLLNLAEILGPHICVLKTHVDLIDDWKPDIYNPLRDIAEKHRFLLFEDRKFADIGATVSRQYHRGIYKISTWADLVTVHGISGPGVLEGLTTQVSSAEFPQGGVIVAQLSCAGNLINEDYSEKCVKMGEENNFVVGLVSQGRLSDKPEMIQFTPGVNLDTKGDSMSQRYVTPEKAIHEKHADVIIVGRGITQADNPAEMAENYKNIAWKAYQSRIK